MAQAPTPDPHRGPARQTADPSERFRVAGADILSHDTWADDDETCPSCGAAVGANDTRCMACSQWLARCSGSCASCASPTCVGGKR